MSLNIPSHLWLSEIVTLGILFALKGAGNRAFYRWLSRDWRTLFSALPERTRLFRLLALNRNWTDEFLATPSVLGVTDSHGTELLPPCAKAAAGSKSGAKGNPTIDCRRQALRAA